MAKIERRLFSVGVYSGEEKVLDVHLSFKDFITQKYKQNLLWFWTVGWAYEDVKMPFK